DKVIEMIKNLNEGTNLEEYLNVDEILRYFAENTFLVNLDSYASNMKHKYYLYEKDGVFEIIPWDYNLSFGAFNIGSGSNAINFPIDSPVTDTLENSPLIG
ncbi:CotH kinase family protein, partial [Clostridium sp. HCS.1]|uniref:CotH kinase family protein n=1 Tax=Clostridium sp. HCS.1 TaxID=3238594 RepID=UPI003A0FF9C9